MEVVVHVPFHLNGRLIPRGTVLTGVAAEIVMHDPHKASCCTVNPHSAIVAPKRTIKVRDSQRPSSSEDAKQL